MQPAAQREACPVCCVSGNWCGLAKHKTDPQNNIQMEIPNMLYELNQNILCNFIPKSRSASDIFPIFYRGWNTLTEPSFLIGSENLR